MIAWPGTPEIWPDPVPALAVPRCWQCGAVPEESYVVRSMETREPVRIIVQWPVGDHEHAEVPPTPEELEQAGHAALIRMLGLV